MFKAKESLRFDKTIVATTTLGTTMADFADRSLGATLGDLFDKPVSQGGLHFSRWVASLILLGCIVACVALIPQRAATKDNPA